MLCMLWLHRLVSAWAGIIWTSDMCFMELCGSDLLASYWTSSRMCHECVSPLEIQISWSARVETVRNVIITSLKLFLIQRGLAELMIASNYEALCQPWPQYHHCDWRAFSMSGAGLSMIDMFNLVWGALPWLSSLRVGLLAHSQDIQGVLALCIADMFFTNVKVRCHTLSIRYDRHIYVKPVTYALITLIRVTFYADDDNLWF